jgi:hypothetical protein
MPLMYCDAALPATGCLAPHVAQNTSLSLTGFPHWQQYGISNVSIVTYVKIRL